MNGETNLELLCRDLKPFLNKGDYVFCSIKENKLPANIKPIAFFFEKEGVSIVVEKNIADTFKLSYSYIASWITLNVHSSLEAVGLTSIVSSALAKESISCNIISAFFHDHLFVPVKDKDKALQILNNFNNSNK